MIKGGKYMKRFKAVPGKGIVASTDSRRAQYVKGSESAEEQRCEELLDEVYAYVEQNYPEIFEFVTDISVETPRHSSRMLGSNGLYRVRFFSEDLSNGYWQCFWDADTEPVQILDSFLDNLIRRESGDTASTPTDSIDPSAYGVMHPEVAKALSDRGLHNLDNLVRDIGDMMWEYGDLGEFLNEHGVKSAETQDLMIRKAYDVLTDIGVSPSVLSSRVGNSDCIKLANILYRDVQDWWADNGYYVG